MTWVRDLDFNASTLKAQSSLHVPTFIALWGSSYEKVSDEEEMYIWFMNDSTLYTKSGQLTLFLLGH